MKKLALIFTSALLYSCGGEQKENTTTETTDESTEVVEVEEPVDNATYLAGIYATSNQSGNDVENLLDGDNNTYWLTEKGTGPDEGVMMTFAKPEYVESISIENYNGSVKYLEIFVNGQRLKQTDNFAKIDVQLDLTSLFIKINSGGESQEVDLDSDECTEATSMVFDKEGQLGLSEVKFFNTDGQIDLKAPIKKKATITASSTLEPETAYNVANLFDARGEFAWVEGIETDGVGESFTVSFDEKVKITGVMIKNGYQRSKKHFDDNTRVKKLSIDVDGKSSTISVSDEMTSSTINFDTPQEGKTFTFKVEEVYPGKKYKDLAISELVFFNDNQVIVPSNDYANTIKSTFTKEVAGTHMEKILNKRLHYSFRVVDCGEFEAAQRSLILRSNGTFVMYEQNNNEDGAESTSEKIVADGNWSVKSKSSKDITIKVFGKHVNLSRVSQAYSGTSQNEALRIFSDNVKIGANQLEGERYVEKFMY